MLRNRRLIQIRATRAISGLDLPEICVYSCQFVVTRAGTKFKDFPAFLSDHLPLFRVSSNSKCVFVLAAPSLGVGGSVRVQRLPRFAIDRHAAEIPFL